MLYSWVVARQVGWVGVEWGRVSFVVIGRHSLEHFHYWGGGDYGVFWRLCWGGAMNLGLADGGSSPVKQISTDSKIHC